MIVKLSCSHSAETPDSNYAVRDSLWCSDCQAVQCIIVIESQTQLPRKKDAVRASYRSQDLRRMWINQPSTLQPYHALHGTHVLALGETDRTCRVYFLSGPVISQHVDCGALSAGWPDQCGTVPKGDTEKP